MTKEDLEIHRIFHDLFWDEFRMQLAKRKTDAEKIDYFQFEIGNQERKLNRYRLDYSPNLYTEDMMVVEEQEQLIKQLKEEYQNFHFQKEGIEPIKLGYQEKNKEVVDLLYKTLHPSFINCKREEFSQLFERQNVSKPMKWLKAENSIVDLFKYQLQILNSPWTEAITGHFVNKNGKSFRHDQLISVSSERAQKNYRDFEIIRSIQQKIRML